MKLLLISGVLLLPFRNRCDAFGHGMFPVPEPGQGPPPNWGPPDGPHSFFDHQSHEHDPSHKRPFLYGLTYYPWRSVDRNCSQITDSYIDEDIKLISTIARNVQIFDLYCDFTSNIVKLAAEYGMGVLLGVSLEDISDYERQKRVLEKLFQGANRTNLSHIIAVTVGRTSMVTNETSTRWIVEKLREISIIVNRTADTPVTVMYDSTQEDPILAPYFDKLKVASAKQWSNTVSDADSFFYGFIDKWKEKSMGGKKRVIFTDFGYPSDIPGSVAPDNKSDGFIPSLMQVQALAKLACIGKGPPDGPHDRGPPMSMPEHGPMSEPFEQQQFEYFYHSTFDLPFEYQKEDPRSHWGLAEFDTRQLKDKLGKALTFPGPGFGSDPFCDKLRPPPGDRGPDNSEATRQWVAIGISLSLAVLAVIASLLFLGCRHRRKMTAQKRKLQQLVNNINSNAYIRTLGSLSGNQDDYLEMICKSDYANLSALVGPKWLIDESAFQFEEIIGEGHFGIVQRAQLSRNGEKVNVAVKKLHVGANNVRQFLSEGIVMEQFHHPNILPLIGISFTSYYLPMIITPFMANGDLLSFVKNASNRLTVRQLLKFGQEIAEGMNYMHNLKLIHRDLAARNCMLDDALIVKVADFGLCRDISDTELYQTARASDIPIRWMAPETIEKLEWTHKSDIWSYGIVLWELFTRGKQPYTRVPLVELRAYLKSGGRLQKPEGCPEVIYDLMKNCWHCQAEQRPGFQHLSDMIPTLVTSLEREQILDVWDYYNSITVMEMVEQEGRDGKGSGEQERHSSLEGKGSGEQQKQSVQDEKDTETQGNHASPEGKDTDVQEMHSGKPGDDLVVAGSAA